MKGVKTKISGLATPALVLDVDALKANMAAMSKILEKSSRKLRPHYKSHKCASLAKWQMENGAIGITCAKLSKVEDLCNIGIADILIANQVIEPTKIRKLADLANNCHLSACDNLVFDGIHAYSGHISHIKDTNTRKNDCRKL